MPNSNGRLNTSSIVKAGASLFTIYLYEYYYSQSGIPQDHWQAKQILNLQAQQPAAGHPLFCSVLGSTLLSGFIMRTSSANRATYVDVAWE